MKVKWSETPRIDRGMRKKRRNTQDRWKDVESWKGRSNGGNRVEVNWKE